VRRVPVLFAVPVRVFLGCGRFSAAPRWELVGCHGCDVVADLKMSGPETRRVRLLGQRRLVRGVYLVRGWPGAYLAREGVANRFTGGCLTGDEI